MLNPKQTIVTQRPLPSFFTVASIRQQLNIYADFSQDVFINTLCEAAQELIEDYIGQYLQPTAAQSYYPYLDSSGLSIPFSNFTVLPIVTYYDASDVLQTLNPNLYFVDYTTTPVLVKATLNASWPSAVSQTRTNPVVISYTTQLFGAQNTQDYYRIRHAGNMIVADFYEHRETTKHQTPKEIPYGVKRLLSKYRQPTL